MFERYTERARQVIILAQDEARTLKHSYIGTEHILLGLLRDEDGLGGRTLRAFNIELDEARDRIREFVGVGDQVVAGQIPFTPRAKKVLELSLREALSLGHNYIGTEHVLLGLIRENAGVAARYLLDAGVTNEELRTQIIRGLSKSPKDPTEDAFTALAQAQAALAKLQLALVNMKSPKP